MYSTDLIPPNAIKNSEVDISVKECKEIWDKIGYTIQREVVENPLGVVFPFYNGEIKTQYLPYKKKTVDWIASGEIGKEVPQLYLNSKGKVSKLIWERREARRYNKSIEMFAFEFLQKIVKDSAKAVSKNPEKYRVAKVKFINRRYDK